MKIIRRLFYRLNGFLLGRRPDADLAEEIELHIQMQTDENLRVGMSPDAARRAALLKFGGLDSIKESYRDQRTVPFLESLLSDVRYAIRGLIKSPGFAAVAVTMLALGIGVNAAVFTVANAALFKGFRLVYRNDRILYICSKNSVSGCYVSYPDFADWRAQAKSFDGMGAVAGDLMFSLSDRSGLSEIYLGTRVSANAFQLLGQRPIMGRDFEHSDEIPGAAPVAILTYDFWERRYGKDPAVIGQTVRINDVPTTLIGVMPRDFSFPQNQALWVPLVPTPDLQKRDARPMWFAFGRLADGATTETARAEMDAIGSRLASAYPATNKGWVPGVRNFTGFFIGLNATIIYGSIWGAVGFVMLIACANLANLMLARAIGRSREISVRIALGAGRWRIVRQLLIESVTLSAVGGVLGWWIAKWGVHVYELAANVPTRLSADNRLDYSMDYRVFAYLIAISIGTGLLCGLAPTFRLSKLDVNNALKDGGRGASGGRRGKRLSTFLVIAEMALAVVLIAGAGVMIRSLLKVYTADIGVKTTNTLTMGLSLPNARYPSAESRMIFFDRLKTRLEAIPGVESMAIADIFPLGVTRSLQYELEGRPSTDTTVSAVIVSPAYFRTLGAPVFAGREFTDFDTGLGVPTVIVNQRFASTFWPGEDALGKRLRLSGGRTPEAWLTVVGVVSNIVQNDFTRQELAPLVYLTYGRRPALSFHIFARTRIPPGPLRTAIRREVQALDPDLPIWLGPFTLDERLAGLGYYWTNSKDAILLLILAAIGLLLASIGLYAIIAHSVSQHTQEIGIRMAIGATAHDILKLVFRQGTLPTGIGLIIGLTASLTVNRLLQSELVQVSPTDPITFVVVCAVLVLSAALGCWIPARRAMRVDPIVALRYE